MAATVVDPSVKSANWSKKKPADYSGKDLDTALKSYEQLSGKDVSVPASLPTMPKQCVSAFEKCIKEMQSAITDMQKAVAHMKQLDKSLQAVASAANKTVSELEKAGKDKQGNDKRAYMDASSAASAIGAQALASAKSLQ